MITYMITDLLNPVPELLSDTTYVQATRIIVIIHHYENTLMVSRSTHSKHFMQVILNKRKKNQFGTIKVTSLALSNCLEWVT